MSASDLAKSAAASVYGAVTSLRNVLFDVSILRVYKSRLPVISVGNISVGGSGKTPFTLYLVEQLLKKGKKPVVLLRGYGGKVKGPHLVQPGDSAKQVGDETLLYRNRFGDSVPVVVARRRAEGARLIEQKELGDCIILDDGFQHRWLARDCDLVLLDLQQVSVKGPLLRQQLLPKGRLREHPRRALKRAQHLLYVSRSMELEERPEPPQHESEFMIRLEPGSLVNLSSREELAPEDFSGKEVIALSAIAQPLPFFAMLEHFGMELKLRLPFRDHHHFSSEELAAAITADVPTIVTEKDAVKIPIPSPDMWALKIKVSFPSPKIEKEFLDSIVSTAFKGKAAVVGSDSSSKSIQNS